MRAPWNGAAQVLDGTATAATIKSELAERVAALRERGIVPGLGTVLVGEDPGSVKYVAGKHADCAEVGIASLRVDLPATASQAEIEEAVDRLNASPAARPRPWPCFRLTTGPATCASWKTPSIAPWC